MNYLRMESVDPESNRYRFYVTAWQPTLWNTWALQRKEPVAWSHSDSLVNREWDTWMRAESMTDVSTKIAAALLERMSA